MRHLARYTVGVVLLQWVGAGGSMAQEEETRLGWMDEAELALVWTAGNSETSTLGFRNVLSRIWENAELHFEVAGLRTETTTITRTPIGSSRDDFVVEESKVTALTAENYLARAKYDRTIAGRLFVYGSGGWERDEFSGIRNRSHGAGGLGNIWLRGEDRRWRTDYGFSVTREEPTRGAGDTFVGFRLSSDFLRRLTESTTLENLTIANENLDNTKDFRVDALTALTVAMADHLSIKLSLRLLFDNVPSFREASLRSPSGEPIGVLVPVQADKLDTRFSLAVVVSL